MLGEDPLSGLRYQVGSGAGISVWYDSWLPLPHNFQPYSVPVVGWEDLEAIDLIDPVSREWQMHMLEELFTSHEVSLIYGIPLSKRSLANMFMWHFDKKGCYSVKSGYRVWMENFGSSGIAASSSGSALSRYWSTVLSLRLPGKIKVFLWRLLRDVVPTRSTLALSEEGAYG